MKCQNCEAPLEAEDRFCGECGHPVATAPPAMTPPPLAAAPPQAAPPTSTTPLPPPAVSPAPVSAAPEPRRRRGCLRSCLIILLVGACLLAILAGGGYFLFLNGTINRGMIEGMLTGGRGEIGVANLTDEYLEAELIQLEGTEDGQPQTFNTLELESLDIGPMGGIPPGRYELVIRGSGTNPSNAVCRLQVGGGDVYQVIAVPEGIAISVEGGTPATAAEVELVTSPLCNR